MEATMDESSTVTSVPTLVSTTDSTNASPVPSHGKQISSQHGCARSMVDELIGKMIKATKRYDHASINHMLGTTASRNIALHERFLPSPQIVNDLLQTMKEDRGGATQKPQSSYANQTQKQRTQRLVMALLAVPPCYRAPWESMRIIFDDPVHAMQSGCEDVLSSIILFLRKSTQGWDQTSITGAHRPHAPTNCDLTIRVSASATQPLSELKISTSNANVNNNANNVEDEGMGTPRGQIIKLAEAIIDLLLDEAAQQNWSDTSINNNNHSENSHSISSTGSTAKQGMLSDVVKLLQCILSIGHRCDRTITDRAFHSIFSHRARMINPLRWMRLCIKLKDHIQLNHAVTILETLKAATGETIVRTWDTGLSIAASACERADTEGRTRLIRSMREVALFAFNRCKSNIPAFLELEASVGAFLQGAPLSVGVGWLQTHQESACSEVPEWIRMNLVILTLISVGQPSMQQTQHRDRQCQPQAYHLSLSTQSLLNDNVPQQQSSFEKVWHRCVRQLLDTTTSSIRSDDLGQPAGARFTVEAESSDLDGMVYDASGQFVGGTKGQVTERTATHVSQANEIAATLRKMLLLYEPHHTHSTEGKDMVLARTARSRNFLQALKMITAQPTEHDIPRHTYRQECYRPSHQNNHHTHRHAGQRSTAMAVWLVVMFCDCPALRKDVMDYVLSLTTGGRGMQARYGSDTCIGPTGSNADPEAQRQACTVLQILFASGELRETPIDVSKYVNISYNSLFQYLPEDLCWSLSRSFMVIPSIRERMLQDACRSFSTCSVRSLRNMEKRMRARQDSTLSAQQHSLLCLLMLLESATWSKPEQSAANLLWKSIILNQPALDSLTRQWLYATIKSVIHKATPSVRGADFLLRACICRLMLFFDHDAATEVTFRPERVASTVQGHSTNTVPEAASAMTIQYEHFQELLGLCFDLLVYSACISSYSTFMHGTLSQQRQKLLRRIIESESPPRRMNEGKDSDGIFDDDANVAVDMDSASWPLPGFLASCELFFVAMSILQDHTNTQLDSQHGHQQSNVRGKRHAETTVQHHSSLYFNPATLKRLNLDTADELVNAWASGLSSKENQLQFHHYLGSGHVVRRRAHGDMLPAIIDFFAELLFVPVSPKQAPSNPFMMSIRGIAQLIRLREKMAPSAGSKQGAKTLGSVSSLFLAVSTVITHCMMQQPSTSATSLRDALSVARYTLDKFCITANSIAQSGNGGHRAWAESIDLHQAPLVFRGLQALYKVIGCEEGASRLASTLASFPPRLSNSPDPARPATGVMASDDQVQMCRRTVQQLRQQLFNALQHCSQCELARLQSTARGHGTLPTGNGAGHADPQQHRHGSISPKAVLSLMTSVSRDLELGQYDHSGGLSDAIVSSMLKTIDGAGRLIHAYVQQFPALDTLPSLLESLVGMIQRMWSTAPKSLPVQNPTSRRLMVLCSSDLPALCYGIIVASWEVCSFDPFSGQAFVSNAIAKMEGTSFEQCARILMTWASLGDADHTPWDDITGISGTRKRGGHGYPNPSALSGPQQLNNANQLGTYGDAAVGQALDQKQISSHAPATKQDWLHTLSSWFCVYRERWRFSMNIVGGSPCEAATDRDDDGVYAHPHTDGGSGSSSSTATNESDCSRDANVAMCRYFHDRQSMLADTLHKTSLVLQPFIETVGGPILEVVSMSLPTPQQLDLLQLLRDTLGAISKSTRVVSNLFESIEADPRRSAHDKSTFVESLCCVYAWLLSCSGHRAAHHDVTILLRIWYLRESRKTALLKENRQRVNPEMMKLLKEVSRMSVNLEKSLGSLRSIILSSSSPPAGSSTPSNSSASQVLRRIGRIVQYNPFNQTPSQPPSLSPGMNLEASLATPSTSQRHEIQRGLLEIIEAKMESLKASTPKLEHLRLSPEKKAKKRTTRSTKKRRHRPKAVPRSRNPLIDEWLRSDLAFDENDVTKEDAYVDLEDFLVAG